MPDVKLVVVPAFYYDAAQKKIVPARMENAILAEDFAPKWLKWRQLAQDRMGWELLISAPDDGGDYTRAMFRTPDDSAMMYQAEPDLATPPDSGPHQSGHAVDLGLVAMSQLYPNYSYTTLVQLAKEAGITNRVYKLNGTEPWHFDDDPATTYGSSYAAISAVGNLTDQVLADIKAGLDTPQMQAIKAALTSPAGIAGIIAVGLLAVVIIAAASSQSSSRMAHA